jgi:tetratricopeptide (TPR) repeat protein
MGHSVIDMLGLTDSTIARHPEPTVEELKTTWKEEKYNSAYILSRQPKYILFSTEFKPSAPAERALFLYSEFLNNYRTIGFFFDGSLHAIFKRYFPVGQEITRDVDPNFPQYIHDALNLWKDEKFPETIANLEKALELCPEPKYPYLLYYIADSRRKMQDLQTSYFMLRQIAERDTLIYEVFKDLYIFERNVLGRPEEALKYRERIRALVPWYLPRLDYLNSRFDRAKSILAPEVDSTGEN